MSEINWLGNLGYAVRENNIYSFQLGENPTAQAILDDPRFINSISVSYTPRWLNLNGYHVYSRGENNLQCEEIEYNIKRNRLHPRLIDKQVKFLYGKGPQGYYKEIQDDKVVRRWVQEPQVFAALDAWQQNGMEYSYTDFAMAVIRRFYTFYDFFVKVRFSRGKSLGRKPIAGLEFVENKNCRLAAPASFNILRDVPSYSDFGFIAFGDWSMINTANMKIYRRYMPSDMAIYSNVAISHHKQNSVGDFYGLNETYEGTKPWIRGANDSPEYINSFLRNSLSAKVHITIPHQWVESKRKQITSLCNENERRQKAGLPLLTINDIELGTTYSEQYLINYTNAEIKRAVDFMSGKENQGKAFVTQSFNDGKNEVSWAFTTLDLKYKEYISSLLEYDKRADEVLVASMGLDPAITGISKEGIISKSGADVYYNWLVYMMSLTPDDEKCSEPFNEIFLRGNFPELYAAGYRIGFYRETPSRQNEVTPNDRLNAQQP